MGWDGGERGVGGGKAGYKGISVDHPPGVTRVVQHTLCQHSAPSTPPLSDPFGRVHTHVFSQPQSCATPPPPPPPTSEPHAPPPPCRIQTHSYWTSVLCSPPSKPLASKPLHQPQTPTHPFPLRRIQTRQAAALMDKRIVVALDGWEPDSSYPHGHYVRTLGTIGDKETETVRGGRGGGGRGVVTRG